MAQHHFASAPKRLALVVVCALAPSIASAQPVERSFEEFLAAQGTYCLPDGIGGCLLLNPPLPNTLVWQDNDDNHCAFVDYAAVASRYVEGTTGGAIDLGTTVRGRVTETANSGERIGTADLTITITVDNALVWVVEGCSLATGRVVFGRTASEVLNGANPTVGSAMLRVRLQTNGFGLPLPDLFQILASPYPTQTFLDITFTANAIGEVRDPVGADAGHLSILHKSVWLHGSPDWNPVVSEMIIVR